MRSRALSTRHQELAPLKQPVGAKGIATEQAGPCTQRADLQVAPLAGLEPATYGLEVDPRSSVLSHRVPSLQVR